MLLRSVPGLVECVAVALCLGAAPALSAPAESPSVPALRQGPLRQADLERWADATFGRWLAERRVSGLAITVVQGDDVVLSRTYGYADWDTKRPVDAATTRFRIASITDSFTGAAITQLLERRRIESLDDPANKYLKRFQLARNEGQEVTILDLMTHRAGFALLGPTGGPAGVPIPLPGDFIKSNLPGYARRRDTHSTFLSVNVSVAGFIVEDVTGRTLAEYLRENVFMPLGMTRTVLSNATEAGPELARSYAFSPTGLPLLLPYVGGPAINLGAAGMDTTAADMARWLSAHLQEGRGTGPAILSAESYRLMHRRLRSNHPAQSGFGMTLFVYDYNGEKVLEQYGNLQTRSLELMLMDSKVGIFLAMAGGGPPPASLAAAATAPAGAPTVVVERPVSSSGARDVILKHFLGGLPMRKGARVDLAKYLGSYESIGHTANYSPSFLATRPFSVVESGDGGLIINGVGVYRPSGKDMFTLDGELPVSSTFIFSNRYAFAAGRDGTMRMYGHVDGGGFERTARQ